MCVGSGADPRDAAVVREHGGSNRSAVGARRDVTHSPVCPDGSASMGRPDGKRRVLLYRDPVVVSSNNNIDRQPSHASHPSNLLITS